MFYLADKVSSQKKKTVVRIRMGEQFLRDLEGNQVAKCKLNGVKPNGTFLWRLVGCNDDDKALVRLI